MTREMLMTVGEVARAYGVTARTLHHYDELGLLEPSERSAAGYRLYTAADLDRLAQIVVYRRLEFPLERVRELLDAGAGDLAPHLRRQRAVVQTRRRELAELARAIDTALEAAMNNRPATEHELKALFGDSFEEWRSEAQVQWGSTDAYRESRRRTKEFTAQDWQAVKDEGARIDRLLVEAATAGGPSSEAAFAAAEVHRAGIERFYRCNYQMHRALADMYLADPRFTAYYENLSPGLAQWLRDAIHANADRVESGLSR